MGRELKRVPLDFSWPLHQVWEGVLNPYNNECKSCAACSGSGYSNGAEELKNKWYGYVPFKPEDKNSTPFEPAHSAIVYLAKRNYPDDLNTQKYEAQRLCRLFNSSWNHHLDENDVAALIEANRLYDFTHTFKAGEGWTKKEPQVIPTPKEVNEWSLVGFGHDGINQHICVSAEAKRLNIDELCSICNGNGESWNSEESRLLSEKWDEELHEPPVGDGYQMWENVTEGSPISPVFETGEKLANWLAQNYPDYANYRQWLKMITDGGWAPSMIMSEGEIQSGVKFIGNTDNNNDPEVKTYDYES